MLSRMRLSFSTFAFFFGLRIRLLVTHISLSHLGLFHGRSLFGSVISVVFPVTALLFRTRFFRTCIFQPCTPVLEFSVLVFSTRTHFAVLYFTFPYLHFPVLAISAPPYFVACAYYVYIKCIPRNALVGYEPVIK